MTPVFTIAYISPNGSTGKVAQALADHLVQNGATVSLIDLVDAENRGPLIDKITTGRDVCLLIGSPVYRDMAVPPVMALIDALPQTADAWAVPFVTYGRACSGVALWQMATALQAKGFQIAGAAKVAAVHAMMWQSDRPEGDGHPDADDLLQVRELADRLMTQFSTGQPVPIPLKILDYQTAERAVEFKAKIAQPWMIVPKTVDENACTECGTCAEACPTDAITLSPKPEFGGACFDCFNCIRLCPEDAIAPAVPLAKIEAMIRARVKDIDEQPLTRIFTAPGNG
ncbi:MAG: EFR1 family ferrodoxin [Pseudomonadota bacterium]